MVLIGYMDDQGAEFAALPQCIEEYWSPTRDWHFLEYVCAEMTITNCLGNLDEMEIYAADADYSHDRDLARHLWGVPPKKVAAPNPAAKAPEVKKANHPGPPA